MQADKLSENFKRRRKFLLILPLLAFPFLVMFFWVLGGGKGDAKSNQKEKTSRGLNMNLPGAHLKDDKGLNKLGFYQEADEDSARLKDKLKSDPYAKRNKTSEREGNKTDSFASEIAANHFGADGFGKIKSGQAGGISLGDQNPDPNAEKVYRKLDELKKIINSPIPPSGGSQAGIPGFGNSFSPAVHDDVSRLEKMMQNIKQSAGGEDPEMTRINGVLDKIIAVQHPEKTRDSLREKSLKNKGEVFPVVIPGKEETISLLGSGKTAVRPDTDENEPGYTETNRPNGFFGLETESQAAPPQNSIEAIIPEDQTLVSGSTVKLQLTDEIYIDGALIPKGTFVFGTAALNGERLIIAIVSIGFQNSVFPVNLQVYDKNGMQGIYIPGAISRDVGKQSADQAVNGLEFTSLDPSVGAQAASAGIQAAKSLISKKIKLVRVTVKENYAVLLKDTRRQEK